MSTFVRPAQPELPTDKELVLKVIPMPADCTTSVTVQVEVYAERFGTQGAYVKVTEASITYVAIDDTGRPRPIQKPQ